MKTIRALVLDFDDVITNSEEAINAELERNGLHEATSTYLEEITRQEKEGKISPENAMEKRNAHFDLKDRVLEEVKDTLIDLETGEREIVDPADFTNVHEVNGKCYVTRNHKTYEFVSQYAGLIDYSKVINLDTVRSRNIEYCNYLLGIFGPFILGFLLVLIFISKSKSKKENTASAPNASTALIRVV